MASNKTEIDALIEQSKQVRDPKEKQWTMNLAFYVGNQWIKYNPVTKQIERPEVPSYRVMLVCNHIQTTVRTELGKLTANRPKYFVAPASNDDDDIKKAKTSEMVLGYLWKTLQLQKKFVKTVNGALVTGNWFTKTYWDSNAGQSFQDDAFDETGMPTGEMKTYATGDVRVDVVSPYELFIDPLATDIDNARYIVHNKVRSREYVLSKYGMDLPEEEFTGSDADPLTGTTFNTSLKTVKGIKVQELWVVPTVDNPAGRYAVWVGGQPVIDGAHPYPELKHPFDHMMHILIPGSLYGDSTVTQLIPVQMEYNKTRSQIAENRNLMSKPKWLIPYGALDEDCHITGAPGEEIVYKNGLKPEAWNPPEIPQYVVEQLDRNMSDINLISGINDVSRGNIAANLRSGVAINYMQEQDNSRLSVTAMMYEDFVASVCKKILTLCAKFYDEPRLIRVVGEDRQVSARYIKKDDLVTEFDIEVLAGSTLPQSKAAKQDFIVQLYQYKIVQDPKLVLKLLDFGGVEGVFDELEVDYNQVDRENERLENGQAIPANEYDNHMVHIAMHNKFRKTAQYEQLDPAIKQLFELHVQQHTAMQPQIDPMQMLMGEGNNEVPTLNDTVNNLGQEGNADLGQQVIRP